MVIASEASAVRQSILDTGQRIIGSKGYSAVGLNEILVGAGVPKGSFYYYFNSKDAFGEALLDRYFESYLAEIDDVLREPGLTMAQRLMNYWTNWRTTQSSFDCDGKCLAVKLGAEVADLSEPMRLSLKRGTAGIIDRLASAIEWGASEGSLSVMETPRKTAESLYQMWLGASVMVKITRTAEPFETAIAMTRRILNLPKV